MEKLLGVGWELSIFRENGRLFIGMPVDCGHWSKNFEFEISESDYATLRQDGHRRKALEFILHERLQHRMAKNDYQNMEDEMQHVIRSVLHRSAIDVEQEISASRNADFIRIRLEKSGFGGA